MQSFLIIKNVYYYGKNIKDSCPVFTAPIVYNINHVKNIKLNNYIIPNRYSSDSLLSNNDFINTIIRNRREIRRNSVSSTGKINTF